MFRFFVLWFLLSIAAGVCLGLYLHLRAGRLRAFFFSDDTLDPNNLVQTPGARAIRVLTISLLWSSFPALFGIVWVALSNG